MNYEELLPIGSVVLLEGATGELIVVGYGYIDENQTEYGYIGCPYPTGEYGDEIYSFGPKNIASIISTGYVDMDELIFKRGIQNKIGKRSFAKLNTNKLTSPDHKQLVPEDSFLPVGTIVKIKGIDLKFMIGGFGMIATNGEIYDYIMYRYPEGKMHFDRNYSFNNEDIEDIIHLGYSNQEDLEYRQEAYDELCEIRKTNSNNKHR